MLNFLNNLLTFHIALFQKEKKEKKERKKGIPPWYVNVGGHPMESVSHDL
jgi:hypothetical protein